MLAQVTTGVLYSLELISSKKKKNEETHEKNHRRYPHPILTATHP